MFGAIWLSFVDHSSKMSTVSTSLVEFQSPVKTIKKRLPRAPVNIFASGPISKYQDQYFFVLVCGVLSFFKVVKVTAQRLWVCELDETTHDSVNHPLTRGVGTDGDEESRFMIYSKSLDMVPLRPDRILAKPSQDDTTCIHLPGARFGGVRSVRATLVDDRVYEYPDPRFG